MRTIKVKKTAPLGPVEHTLRILGKRVSIPMLQVPVFHGILEIDDKKFVYQVLAHYERVGNVLRLHRVFERIIGRVVGRREDHWVVHPINTEEELNLLAKVRGVIAVKNTVRFPEEAIIPYKRIVITKDKKRLEYV